MVFDMGLVEVGVVAGLIYFDAVSSVVFPMVVCGFSKQLCDFYHHESNGLTLSPFSEVMSALAGIIAAALVFIVVIRFILGFLATNAQRYLGMAILLGLNGLWVVKSMYELLGIALQGASGSTDGDGKDQRFSESIHGVYMTLFTFSMLKVTGYAVLFLLIFNEMPV